MYNTYIQHCYCIQHIIPIYGSMERDEKLRHTWNSGFINIIIIVNIADVSTIEDIMHVDLKNLAIIIGSMHSSHSEIWHL